MSVFLRHLKECPIISFPTGFLAGEPKRNHRYYDTYKCRIPQYVQVSHRMSTAADGWLSTNQYAILLLYGQSDSYQTPPHKKLDKLHPDASNEILPLRTVLIAHDRNCLLYNPGHRTTPSGMNGSHYLLSSIV